MGWAPLVKDHSGSLLVIRGLSTKLLVPSGSMIMGSKESGTLATV